MSEFFEPVEADRELPVNAKREIHGRPRCTWPSGDVHEGDYVDGVRHGTGTYSHADGRVYVGEYQDDKRHGKATYTSKSGRARTRAAA